MAKLGIHRPFATILLESFVVGVVFALLFAGMAALAGQSGGTDRATGIAFGTAVLAHWVFEATGLNERYCSYARW